MKKTDKEKLLRYVAELNVLIQGCSSAGCPFWVDGEDKLGTANLCKCHYRSKELLKAIQEIIK